MADIATYFDQLYSGKASNALEQAFMDSQKQTANLNNIRSASPEALQFATKDPNGVTAALGFQDAGEILGMSPAQYQTMLAPKETPTQILQRNLNMADQITGAPELRKNLQSGIDRNLAGRQNLVGDATRFASSMVGDDKRTAASIEADKVKAAAKLIQDKIDNSFKREELGLRKRQLDIMASEIKMAKETAARNASQNPTNPWISSDDAAKMGDQYIQTLKNDPKATNVATPYYMKSKLYEGSVTHGTLLPLPAGYTVALQDGSGANATFNESIFSDGSNKLAPRPGFYGRYTDNNGKKVMVPLVLTEMPRPRSGSGGSTNTPYKRFGSDGN